MKGMKDNLQKNWWVLAVNGLIAVVFGGLAFFASQDLMKTISTFIGLLILVGGVLLLLGAYDLRRKEHDYALMLTEGVIATITGILIMIFPLQTMNIFITFIGVWALFIGLLQIYLAIVMRKVLVNIYVLIIGGLVLCGIGIILLINPEIILGFVSVLGIVLIVLGMLQVYYAFVIKRAKTSESP
jgi:uncharacterized membrane protein HdeD (DUF308 family)